MSDDLQVIHNLCLSEMRFDGRIARCLYCEDVDREENARTGVELARLTAELSETQKRLAVAEKRIEKIHARMRQFQEYTVPNDVIVMWLDKWIAEELSQAKED